MQECWKENPDERPTMNSVKSAIRPLTKGMKSNIFDNMMDLMEKYTNNLEKIVGERTKDLDMERRRSERLLLQMLPE